MRLRANASKGRKTEELRAAYELHGAIVFVVASYLVGLDVAEDVTAQVFRDLWRHPDAFDPDAGSLRLFLIAAAYRTCSQTSERAGEHYAADKHPIRFALEQLSSVEREAVLTVRFGECSYHEAASAMHMQDATLRLLVGHGLESLSANLRSPQPGLPQSGVALF